MGIPHILRNLHNGKLPLKITSLETDVNFSDYKQITNGKLQYIGIDGAVFIHSHIIKNNNNETVNIKKSSIEIGSTILKYIQVILLLFNKFKEVEEEGNVIIHFVVDGLPPRKKNRRAFIDENGNFNYIKQDAYTTMTGEKKHELHKKIIFYLIKYLQPINYNNNKDHQIEITDIFQNTKFTLLTNHKVKPSQRGEGEISLYKMCTALNQKKTDSKNVIISSDSDLLSLILMHDDQNSILILPSVNRHTDIYMTNYNLVKKNLHLESHGQIIKYVLLHFILFGSDYNWGLMTNPNDSKQKIIYETVRYDKDANIDAICRQCPRKRKKKSPKGNNNNDEDNSCLERDHEFLEHFKNLLIYEALCAFMYYYDIQNGSQYIQTFSPCLYINCPDMKHLIPYLNF